MAGSSASKNVFCANSGAYPYTMNVSWSESSTNVANNTSVISASGSMGGQYISFDSGGYAYYLRLYWHDNRTNSDTHFASSGAFSSMGMRYGSRYVSGSIAVTHKDDGSLSGYVWMRFESPSTSGGWAPGTTDLATGNTALTTIARASSFTINAGSALLGSAVSITIDRKSSSFTHKVAYTFAGSSSTSVSTNAATSASFTPPISLASQIPNTTTGTLTITVTTMNGGTQIGSPVSKSVNLGVPTSVVPTMGTPTATRVNNGVPSSWGVYVKAFSKCTVAIVSAAGVYGSTIKSYSITGGGLNSTEQTATTGVLTTAGTIIFTCRITDSRGRTASKTVSITVVDYSGPSLSVSANRCNSSGVATAEGTYLRVTVNYSFSSVSGKNSIASKSVTCNGVSNTTFGDNSPFTLAANCSIGKTYVLTAKVTDALGKSYTASIDIRTASRILNVRKAKDGIAIGKFSEKAGFEIGWPAYFDKLACFKGGTYVHSSRGTEGQNGYLKMVRMTIIQTYRNTPIKMTFVQRGMRSTATLYIAFRNDDTADPPLNSSYFVFEGDEAYDIYIHKSSTSSWDLYVHKAESYDSVAILDLSTDYEYMSAGAIKIDLMKEQVSSLPSGCLKATHIGNLARYASGTLDPNTTMYSLILTSHSNKPSTASTFWYITTLFHEAKTVSSPKAQIAYPYDKKASIYHRFYYKGSWSAWTRLISEDETVPKVWESGTVHPYGNGNSLSLKIWKTFHMCICKVYWVGSVGASTATLNEINIPEDFRPNTNHYATTRNVSGTSQWGTTRIGIGSDGKFTFHTDNTGFLERMVTLTWINDE